MLLLLSLLPAAVLGAADYPENPLLVDDSIYVSRQGVFRFDTDGGDPSWSSLVGIETFDPVVHGDLLLVGSTRGLYALERKTGIVSWHIEEKSTLFTPAVSGLAYAGSVHGELYAVDPASGRLVWRRQFTGWVYSPAIAGGNQDIWTGGQDHKLSALDPGSGDLLIEIPTTQELVFSPVDLGDGRIAVNLFDGSTLLVAADSGKIEFTLESGATPGDIRRDGDTIYRSHRDGSLFAFDARDGRLKQRQKLAGADLVMYPSRPGFLLLGGGGRELTLLKLADEGAACRLRIEGKWALPVHAGSTRIYYFRESTQPSVPQLVDKRATCEQTEGEPK